MFAVAIALCSAPMGAFVELVLIPAAIVGLLALTLR